MAQQQRNTVLSVQWLLQDCGTDWAGDDLRRGLHVDSRAPQHMHTSRHQRANPM